VLGNELEGSPIEGLEWMDPFGVCPPKYAYPAGSLSSDCLEGGMLLSRDPGGAPTARKLGSWDPLLSPKPPKWLFRLGPYGFSLVSSTNDLGRLSMPRNWPPRPTAVVALSKNGEPWWREGLSLVRFGEVLPEFVLEAPLFSDDHGPHTSASEFAASAPEPVGALENGSSEPANPESASSRGQREEGKLPRDPISSRLFEKGEFQIFEFQFAAPKPELKVCGALSSLVLFVMVGN
jgi:hypothetical protein